LTQGGIATAHGSCSRIRQVAPVCTPHVTHGFLAPHEIEPTRLRRSSSDHSIDAARALLRSGAGGRYRSTSGCYRWDRQTVASELWGQGGTLYPQVQDLYPLYPSSQRCGLCQHFKQTTLTTRLYKVRTNLYPPHTNRGVYAI